MQLLLKDQSQLVELILNTSDDMMIVIDDQLRVHYMNDSARRVLKLEEADYKGLHLYKELNLMEIAQGRTIPILQELLEQGTAQKGIIRKTASGRYLSINATPLLEQGVKKGLLLTAQDITKYIDMERELDMAFALTLPNSKVEYKLKSSVEYQDTYDPAAKKITITGVIRDGGYRHVVNCLKLFSNLHEQGVTKVIGIDKDKLVQAFIFHDLGKSQPDLSVGDVVDPTKVFEDSRLHAFRSAEIAKHYYDQDEDIVEIIRYHHHREEDLPDGFPWRLLPLLRLFKLIDGLSAAITRGGVKVTFQLRDCVVQVSEVNQRPQYNGLWEIDLYTGKKIRLN